VKIRRGGVLSRGGAPLTVHEQRALDGDARAMRALVRQAIGVNTMDLRLQPGMVKVRAAGAGNDRLEFYRTFTALDHPFAMGDWLGDFTEIMHAGSLDRTLGMSPDVQYTPNHNWDLVPMARTVAGSLDLHPDGTCDARLDGSRADVHTLASAIDGGEINAMSFAFWVVQQTWSPDYEQRDILEVDMDGGDVSPVTHPANPGTTGTIGLRKRQASGLLRSRVPALLSERIRAEKRADGDLSDATRVVLQAVLDLVAAADVAVDYAQPMLADLLGVTNPDDDQDDQADDDATVDGNPDATPTNPALWSLTRMRLFEDARRTA